MSSDASSKRGLSESQEAWPLWYLLQSSDEEDMACEAKQMRMKRPYDQCYSPENEGHGTEDGSMKSSRLHSQSTQSTDCPQSSQESQPSTRKKVLSWSQTLDTFFDVEKLRNSMRRPLRLHTGCSGTGAATLFLQELCCQEAWVDLDRVRQIVGARFDVG